MERYNEDNEVNESNESTKVMFLMNCKLYNQFFLHILNISECAGTMLQALLHVQEGFQ